LTKDFLALPGVNRGPPYRHASGRRKISGL
jgi:hypothetical protein